MPVRRMTAAEYLDAAARPKGRQRVKGARRTVIGDMTFDSALEGRWWGLLAARQAAGRISGLRRQVPIPLLGRDGPILTPTGRPMTYRADFVWIENGREQIGDAKGHPTEVYLLKRAILAAQGIVIREFR